MKISHGLLTGQVLQRNAEDKGGATISGSCEATGKVELRLLKAGKVLRGHDWCVAGVAADGAFEADLEGVRTGGPYRVEMRIRKGRKIVERLAVEEIFVGDVWILAGQSNMEGVGNLADAPKSHPQVRAFFMRDEWAVAEEKLHYLGEAVDKVHNGYGNERGRPSKAELEKVRARLVKGTSPGLPFALEMQRRTKVPQGVIACAHGGTSMAEWSPELRDMGGDSLYGAMMRRYEKLGQAVAGVVWYQGESDANPEAAAVYTQKMVELVESTRRDMVLPKLPWVIVQLGCHSSPEDGKSWNSIQEQQRLLPNVIKRLDVAPAIDLELDDGIHIGGKAQQVLGQRLARLADRLVHKAAGVKPGIVLKRIELVPTPNCNAGAASTAVQLTYGNVAGGLMSEGRPTGFVLFNEQGEDVAGIYRTTVKGNCVLLHTNMARPQLEMLSVSYGHGRQPYCNITDREGMSIPVLQAVPVAPDHMVDISDWETALLPGVKSLTRVGLGKMERATGWAPAPPRAGFGTLPKDAGLDQVGVYAMRTTLTAGEALSGLLVFGANSPFKIWLNGKLVWADPEAAPPLNPAQYEVPLKLKSGSNSLLVAFAPHVAGAHIGISARIGSAEWKADSRISC